MFCLIEKWNVGVTGLGISKRTLSHFPCLRLDPSYLPILSYIFLMENILNKSRRYVYGRVLGTSEAPAPAGEPMQWNLSASIARPLGIVKFFRIGIWLVGRRESFVTNVYSM